MDDEKQFIGALENHWDLLRYYLASKDAGLTDLEKLRLAILDLETMCVSGEDNKDTYTGKT
jgi:hypothetical protein